MEKRSFLLFSCGGVGWFVGVAHVTLRVVRPIGWFAWFRFMVHRLSFLNYDSFALLQACFCMHHAFLSG